VDRVAHQAEADGTPLSDQVRQLLRLECIEAGPQADIGRIRHLRLHSHQVLDLVGGGRFMAVKQMLSRE
jgi:hypothetical protein